ncbi:hypothetical protein Csa_006661 [Cucumis sativus]|uniref:Uncharacterized protein n=1 Tax=Cucumis sativus TaxID=3659 RepID=A0A0A0LNS2_CUCSA|nr:hypothetical protein Csa_006661 [Cucumis sativus]
MLEGIDEGKEWRRQKFSHRNSACQNDCRETRIGISIPDEQRSKHREFLRRNHVEETALPMSACDIGHRTLSTYLQASKEELSQHYLAKLLFDVLKMRWGTLLFPDR